MISWQFIRNMWLKLMQSDSKRYSYFNLAH